MFAAVYSWRAMGPAVLDPEVGIDFSRLVHGGQDFTWHTPVVAGDEITTEAGFVEKVKRGEINVFTFSSRSVNQRGELVCEGTWTNFVR
jgi:acyl dehydratase